MVQLPNPITWHASDRSGNTLISRVRRGFDHRRAVEHLTGSEAVEPVLPGFEALHDRVSGLDGVLTGVAAERVVAAADVAALGASPQVEPPGPGGFAFDATRSARRNAGVDRCVVHGESPSRAVSLQSPWIGDSKTRPMAGGCRRC